MSKGENWPTSSTEEETHLSEMFSWLRRLRTAVAEEKKAKSEAKAGKAAASTSSSSTHATEAAKRLAASGALHLAKASAPKSSFKRSARLKDASPSAASAGSKFTAYSEAMLGDYSATQEAEFRQRRGAKAKPPSAGLYSNFVSGGSTKGGGGAGGGGERAVKRERTLSSSGGEDGGWGDEVPTGSGQAEEEGRAILVRGFDLMEAPLRAAFASFGEIRSLEILDRRRSANIAFAASSEATKALKEMNGNMVNGVTIRVSLARDEVGKAHPWSQPAPPPSKAPKKEPPPRALLTYNDDDIF